ncbi:unnamed protein product [Allacma fusca]|uniref:Uncharacterized protein n=1 Tax=Allacma fusca TaxID=39272 RepID=A0A8J2JMZ6_9HEXA|nr:unnamed protein product [Allacma fusca]
MKDFMVFLVALTIVIFCLVMLYTCCNFWFNTRNSLTVDVYPVVELSRPSYVRETNKATFVSVFYSSNEITLQNELNEIPKSKGKATPPPEDSSPTDSQKVDTPGTEGSSEPKKKEQKQEKPKTMESIQAGHMVKPWTSAELGCELAIGVHANEDRIAGYCLDLRNKTCEFYSYETFRLPWTLQEVIRGNKTADEPGDDVDGSTSSKVDKKWLSECQSKNLMFALILWEDKIKELKKFKLYTDDDTSRRPTNEYGKRVRGLLAHMEECEKLYKVNTMIVVNGSMTDKYIRYIQPAVELSKLRLPFFADYIAGAYGIERFDGTHEYAGDDEEDGKEGKKSMMYYTTKYFETFLLTVKRRVLNWKLNPCYQCRFGISRSPSLQSIQVSASNSKLGQPVLSKTGREGSKHSTMSKAPASSLNRKYQKSQFPTFKWKRSDSHEHEKYSKKHCHDLDPSAPPDSEDSLSTSSKTTSGDYATSNNKSNSSSKGNLRFFR